MRCRPFSLGEGTLPGLLRVFTFSPLPVVCAAVLTHAWSLLQSPVCRMRLPLMNSQTTTKSR